MVWILIFVSAFVSELSVRDSVGEEEEPVHCLAWQKCVVPLNCFGGSGGNIIKEIKDWLCGCLMRQYWMWLRYLLIWLIRGFFSKSPLRLDGREIYFVWFILISSDFRSWNRSFYAWIMDCDGLMYFALCSFVLKTCETRKNGW